MPEEGMGNSKMVADLLDHLGWINSWEKSDLVSKQDVIFLGYRLNSITQMAEDKVSKMRA